MGRHGHSMRQVLRRVCSTLDACGRAAVGVAVATLWTGPAVPSALAACGRSAEPPSAPPVESSPAPPGASDGVPRPKPSSADSTVSAPRAVPAVSGVAGAGASTAPSRPGSSAASPPPQRTGPIAPTLPAAPPVAQPYLFGPALGPIGARRPTGPLPPGGVLRVSDLVRVDSGRVDQSALATSLRAFPEIDLRSAGNFDTLYQVPANANSPFAGQFVRVSGGMYAVFPSSVYRAGRNNTRLAAIPPDTTFFMGGIPGQLASVSAAPRPSPAAEAPTSLRTNGERESAKLDAISVSTRQTFSDEATRQARVSRLIEIAKRGEGDK